MKRLELRQLIKEILSEQKKMKIDNVIVSYSKSGNRTLEIPQGMTSEALSKWLEKNKEKLDKEFPLKK